MPGRQPFPLALPLAALLATGTAVAASDALPGVSTQFGDWLVVCDNLGTCHAVGYSADGDSLPVSVLLRREAGRKAQTQATVLLGEPVDSTAPVAMPGEALVLMPTGEPIRLRVDPATGRATVPTKAVERLIAALWSDQPLTIANTSDERLWELSPTGAAAALAHWTAQWPRMERRAAPLIHAVGPQPARPGDAALATRDGAALREALRAADTEGDCIRLQDHADAGTVPALRVERLDAQQLLVSTRCWLAAYNEGNGIWIVDDRPPYAARLVTVDATDLTVRPERIAWESTQRGRGFGDCWSRERQVWDGIGFVISEVSSAGLCRGFPGGAWVLTTHITRVIDAPAPATAGP